MQVQTGYGVTASHLCLWPSDRSLWIPPPTTTLSIIITLKGRVAASCSEDVDEEHAMWWHQAVYQTRCRAAWSLPVALEPIKPDLCWSTRPEFVLFFLLFQNLSRSLSAASVGLLGFLFYIQLIKKHFRISQNWTLYNKIFAEKKPDLLDSDNWTCFMDPVLGTGSHCYSYCSLTAVNLVINIKDLFISMGFSNTYLMPTAQHSTKNRPRFYRTTRLESK